MSKRTAEYWKKRFEALEAASNAYGQQTFRQIEPAFDKAQKEIQNQIETWYGRFARNNNITMQEAKKLLTTNELKEFRWDVKEYIKYGRENDLNQAWMKELENASARVHINRLEALKIRTQHAAEVAFGNELDCLDAMARKVFTENYYHTIYEVQKGFGIGWEIGQIDERKLETLISKPWAADGKNFSQRIWGQRSQLVNELHNQLTRTCILGKAPDDAINAISKKFNTTKSQAGRLVMTEQAYFHSVAQKDAFDELDVEEFEIVATLDSHTSEICQELDGKHFPMKDYEPGVTAPPFHVWCRSVTVPWFEDNFDGERAARDEDGNTYYVPDSMTYKDWKKSMVDGDTDGLKVVGERKPKFVPATTIEEAEKYAKRFVFHEEYSMRGEKVISEGITNFNKMNLEYANTLNETLQDAFDTYDIEPLKSIEMMNFRQKQWQGAETAGGAYESSVRGSIYFNPKIFSNQTTLKKHINELYSATDKALSKVDSFLSRGTADESLVKQLQALKQSGRLGSKQIVDVGDSAKATFVHEIGHMLDYKKFKSAYKEYNFKVSDSMSKYGYKISAYAMSSADEYVAESFVMHWFGHDELIDPDLIKIFEGMKRK